MRALIGCSRKRKNILCEDFGVKKFQERSAAEETVGTEMRGETERARFRVSAAEKKRGRDAWGKQGTRNLDFQPFIYNFDAFLSAKATD